MGKKQKTQLAQNGVQLSVKGVKAFVRNIDRATAAVDRFTAAIERANNAEIGVVGLDECVDRAVAKALAG